MRMHACHLRGQSGIRTRRRCLREHADTKNHFTDIVVPGLPPFSDSAARVKAGRLCVVNTHTASGEAKLSSRSEKCDAIYCKRIIVSRYTLGRYSLP